MPELPEVQTVVKDMLECGLIGRQISAIDSDWQRMIVPWTLEQTRTRIVGAQIQAISRRAKYIVMTLSNITMLMHLRMSGRIFIAESNSPRSPYVHFSLLLDDGREIRFHDTRKFGKVYFADDPNCYFNKLGVEPLGKDFNLHFLRSALLRRNRMLKPLLLDQSIIAGLGNIYVDEALWESEIHPQTLAGHLSESDLRSLRFAIPKVLRSGIRNGGTSLGSGYGNYTSISGRAGTNMSALKVYGRSHKPCLKCGVAIQKITVAQRGTHICPHCQTPK